MAYLEMAYLEHVSQPSMVQLARLGDFRAIAYWLNACLVPQGIYARVAADRPGVLLILLEFMRLPRRDRLNHLVCHRLCRLNSRVIRGVRILARFVDSDDILWDTSVRLLVPGRSPRRSRRRRTPARSAPPRRSPAPLPQQAANLRRIQALVSTPSMPHLLGSPPMAALPPARQRDSVRHPIAALPPARRVEPMAHRRPRRRRVSPRPPALRLTPQVLQRVGATAAAIFLLGWGVETWKQLDAGTVLGDWMNQRVSVRTPSGRVPVIEGGQDTNNPIVTLTFAGGGPAPTVRNPESATANPAQPTGAPSPAPGSSVSTASDTPRRTPPQSSGDPIPWRARPIPRADVMLANLNQSLAIANPEAALPTPFKAPENASIRLVNVSGQAVAGADPKELVQTLDTLQETGLHPLGAGRNRQEARQPEIVEVRGKRIAYLSYSDGEDLAAGRWRPGSNPALEGAIAEDIQTIRNQVDWVVVNYHWNQDLSSYPAEWQTQLARSAVDQGADLVVGYHPQVLQGAEIYKGRVIAYSLGNFIFTNQPQNPQSDYDSAVLKVSLKDDRMRLEFVPVEVQGDAAAIATGEKARDILTYIEQSSALFEQPMKSPTILDRLALDPNQPTPPAEFTGPAEGQVKPTPEGDSFITYPSGSEGTPATPQKVTPTPDAAPEPASPGDDLESNGVDSPISEPQAKLAPAPESSEVSENPSSDTAMAPEVGATVEESTLTVEEMEGDLEVLAPEPSDSKQLEVETWDSEALAEDEPVDETEVE